MQHAEKSKVSLDLKHILDAPLSSSLGDDYVRACNWLKEFLLQLSKHMKLIREERNITINIKIIWEVHKHNTT